MSKDEKKTKKKVRRIIGKPLALIRKAMKRTQQKMEERDKWRREYMEEKVLCEDQVHWGLHVIFDADPKGIGKEVKIDPATKAISLGDRVVVGRVDRDTVKKDGEFAREIQKLDEQAADVIEKWALRMGCHPKQVDLQTGIITDEDDECIYEGVDPSKLPNPFEDLDDTDIPDEPADEGADL